MALPGSVQPRFTKIEKQIINKKPFWLICSCYIYKNLDTDKYNAG